MVTIKLSIEWVNGVEDAHPLEYHIDVYKFQRVRTVPHNIGDGLPQFGPDLDCVSSSLRLGRQQLCELVYGVEVVQNVRRRSRSPLSVEGKSQIVF